MSFIKAYDQTKNQSLMMNLLESYTDMLNGLPAYTVENKTEDVNGILLFPCIYQQPKLVARSERFYVGEGGKGAKWVLKCH